LLQKNGEFYPFGSVIKKDKTINPVVYYDGNEHPNSEELIEKLENTYRELAVDGEIVASGIVYDTKISANDNDDTVVDAIIVSLEHINDYSAKVCFLYHIEKIRSKKSVVIDDVIAMEGSNNVFI
jgi:hypothetical protein